MKRKGTVYLIEIFIISFILLLGCIKDNEEINRIDSIWIHENDNESSKHKYIWKLNFLNEKTLLFSTLFFKYDSVNKRWKLDEEIEIEAKYTNNRGYLNFEQGPDGLKWAHFRIDKDTLFWTPHIHVHTGNSNSLLGEWDGYDFENKNTHIEINDTMFVEKITYDLHTSIDSSYFVDLDTTYYLIEPINIYRGRPHHGLPKNDEKRDTTEFGFLIFNDTLLRHSYKSEIVFLKY